MDSTNIPVWELLQKQMIAMEQRVCEIEEFKAIASFHHMILRKK